MSSLRLFHAAVSAWFRGALGAPTDVQARAWGAIHAGRDTLIAAPTGSGKTLAAFLAAIDSLVRQGLESPLPVETRIVYVSPLKALSNDIQKNLDAPLAGVRAALLAQGLPDVDIRAWVRTGDTPTSERNKMRRRPPHIVVTTPESLYILLGSESGRKMLATTRTVIVDEIHALAPNKRGAHLSLSLERLQNLCGGRLQRIGLSATQKPIETVARFLVGAKERECEIVDAGHERPRDLALEVPSSPLEAVMSNEVWTEVYDRIAELANAHRTTLVFVNTRRMSERVARHLSERLGEAEVASHHGSMAKELRLDAEQKLKSGALKVLVATASLELGIDIGDVDLVCQLGSPRSIASFLQRAGRSGHAVRGTPKARLFPLSRDDLVECAALLDSVRRGELDALTIPPQPLDVLAQQIVAEVAMRDCNEDELLALVRRAWPYRDLSIETFSAVIRMLGDGFATRRGRRGALVHHDAINHVLRSRRGARLTAVTSGGAIPDNADYQVLLEPENQAVGSVNEDFAVESISGDVFQLGNRTYRILRVERGLVRVEDARGSPPNIPFWLGEAPSRSDELSFAVSRLRAESAERVRVGADLATIVETLTDKGMTPSAAEQLCEYLVTSHAALGCLPTQDRIVLERFFDEAGGMQLVIHSPYGGRINRAWGLALRKRFCRKFNFELQAAATEDNIVLSLTTAHSFELEDAARYLHSASARGVLIQAVLDAPMFASRWRWTAGIALAIPRMRAGRRVPPQFTRMEAEDLVAAVFPDQIACLENIVGEREVPDHPLVNQTLEDCLHVAMDIVGLEELLVGIESGQIAVVARDLTEPSPLALEVLSAKPYAFLDDAPLEERRTQAVANRRWLDPNSASELGRLDPEAIAKVRAEAWPEPVSADEVHDALLGLGFVGAEEAAGWTNWLEDLAKQRRVVRLRDKAGDVWIAAERLSLWRALWPLARREPDLETPKGFDETWTREAALSEVLRGRLEGLGPVSSLALAASLGLEAGEIATALAALEAEGFAMRGRFTAGANAEEWCQRGLLARIHRYTVNRLRAEIEPAAARDFLRFLFSWQHVAAPARREGPEALAATIKQLEGFEAPAGAWESEILTARIADYEPHWLDDECLAGRVAWARLRPRPATTNGGCRGVAPVRTTPIALLARRDAPLWQSLAARADSVAPSPRAQTVLDYIREHGASFYDELLAGAGLLRSPLEDALSELVALGLVTSDSFGGLRALLVPSEQRKLGPGGRRRRKTVGYGLEDAGRWALTRRPRPDASSTASPEAIEHAARALLLRYGVVFWRMLEREAGWLPPWRELLRVYRRLEARGEIRGGRFVAGFSGEQFALPEAIGLMRETRRAKLTGDFVCLSGADPLNLIGIVTPGAKLSPLTGNRVLYRDGLAVACLSSGEVNFHQELEPGDQWQARKTLARGVKLRLVDDAETAPAVLAGVD